MLVLPPVLRARGYGKHGDRYGVDPARHLMVRYGSTPAFDARAITYWKDHNVQLLKAHLTDGRVMLAGFEDFLRTAERFENAYGSQYASTDPSIWTTVDERR